jgi:hypothetical protein
MKKVFFLGLILFSSVFAQAQPIAGSTITTEKQKFILENITTELQSALGSGLSTRRKNAR